MPNGFTGCVLVKLPIVIADVTDSITVDNTTCLDELAKKVDHIDVVVRDLEADPVFGRTIAPVHLPGFRQNVITPGQYPGYVQNYCNSPKATVHAFEVECGPRELKSITVSGTIHKQIYYVNKHDDVRHLGEDIPFTKTVKLEPPLPVMNPGNIDIEFKDVDVDVAFDIPRPTRINQSATVSFVIKITEDHQIFIQTCIPDQDLVGQQVLANTGFEAFSGCVLDVWQTANVVPGQPGRNGGFSVGLAGPAPSECLPTVPNTASLVQSIPSEVIRPGLKYEFCFYIQDVVPTGIVENYTVEAKISFYDATGQVINSSAVTTVDENAVTGTWKQVCVTSNAAPEGAVSGNVSIVYTRGTGDNGSFVRIDDATLTVRS
ncbi:hypothetical protein Dred_0083 [Desulforamulus reducens MI-1]|uniref:SipL SPOCS domain-containing protein n=1 Tax=Desulforamulus reducens (strain ATCC BAA-1160 / DSM 100696 / MI-1) TaxID=349161 RepID=A4J0N0_DESRM|nr:DUF3794 domain-containing protein [Desulforamulus reducens]ABO48633.1 hypothetical protein Dred_0083 [Desulforamulus reducens MI-1]